MRLRPSGRAGPLASRLDSFADYQEREAWTWEHMALTRARVISSSPGFGKKIEDVIRAVLIRPRDPAATAADVADMRRAIAQEKGEDDIWDLKYAAGGTVDIDFIAQHLQLVHAADKPDILNVSTLAVLDNAARLGVLAQSDAEVLRARGAALSRPDADHPALRQRQVQSGNRGRGPAAGDGAGRGYARLLDACRRGCARRRPRCGGCSTRLSAGLGRFAGGIGR